MAYIRKVGVIGQGHVGAHVANALLMQGLADELYLCDINEQKLTSEAQDFTTPCRSTPATARLSPAAPSTRSSPAATSS